MDFIALYDHLYCDFPKELYNANTFKTRKKVMGWELLLLKYCEENILFAP